MNKILVFGGYGSFSERIVKALLKARLSVIIAGRSQKKAKMLYDNIRKDYKEARLDIAVFDVNNGISEALKKHKPNIFIDAFGPFQNKDYTVVEKCLMHNCHYIDLANNMEFVSGIRKYDEIARDKNLTVISGASITPGLSSAVISNYKDEFIKINSLKYGITLGKKAERGLATSMSILNSVGKRIVPSTRKKDMRYGWQDIFRQDYPFIGKRWMANCGIADLDIFPNYYDIDDVRFFVGIESGSLHLGMYFISWLVRMKLIENMSRFANLLHMFSRLFDFWGTYGGGMFVELSGLDYNLKEKKINWYLISKNGDALHIPSIAAIILAKKIALSECNFKGASACVELIELDEFLYELKRYQIEVFDVRQGQESTQFKSNQLSLARS